MEIRAGVAAPDDTLDLTLSAILMMGDGWHPKLKSGGVGYEYGGADQF